MKNIIALYLRLSKHDEDVDENMESNSIGNQRGIIREYLKVHFNTSGYEVREFIDDGFSGTTMERPAMQNMLKLVEAGKIYAILVKDLSRFARNYLKSAYYMEKVFPAFGVRFICVNDNYDSVNIAYQLPGMDMAFKGIIHDYYCKELSKKLKIARRQQVENGKCIFPKPPYGYWKSETQKGLLIIDENTAPVVKFIFNRYVQGDSAYRIAQELNKRDIPSPNKRLVDVGIVSFRDNQYVKGLCWNNGMILSILRNQIYIGNMVGGKEERVKMCDRNCRKKDRDEWIIVQGTHEPIIEKELFYQVQDILQDKTRKRDKNVGSPKIFSGKLICGSCFAIMTKSGEHKGVEYYACSKCRVMGRKAMTVHSDFLEKKIIEKIEGCVIPDSLMFPQSAEASLPDRPMELAIEKKRKGEVDARGQELLADYERYAEGLITREEYEERRRAFHEKKTQKEKNPAPEREIVAEDKEIKGTREMIRADSKMNHEIVDYFVERILVNGAEDIQIEWKGDRLEKDRVL